MKHGFITFLLLSVVTFLAGGCSFLFKGESAPLKKTVISVSVPTDPGPPVVKPLALPDNRSQATTRELKPVKVVESRLLPNELPLHDGVLKTASNPLNHHVQSDPSGIDVTVISAGRTFAEDVTWKGLVLIKGTVIIAPLATIRMEPGTVVRFSAANASNAPARLIIQGRIQAVGTADRPILLTSERTTSTTAEWDGLLFLSTEKRNQLEHCIIEYARTAIDARFSSLALRNVSIINSQTGVFSRDSVLQFVGGSVNRAATGIELHDSECDLKDITINACQNGLVIYRSSVTLAATRISDNDQCGLASNESRIRITSSEFSSNGVAARIKGGSGQILLTSFLRNRSTALHISGARLKINRCSFLENAGDGIRLDDGKALVWGNVFSENAGFNIYHAGGDDVNALQNWWGATDQFGIANKIFDRQREPRSGKVHFFPWLNEKPLLIP